MNSYLCAEAKLHLIFTLRYTRIYLLNAVTWISYATVYSIIHPDRNKRKPYTHLVN